MNLREALTAARKKLDESGIEDTGLESEVLLRYSLNIGRTFLFTNPEHEILQDDYRKFQKLLERRCAGEPTAYITGNREFYGLDFKVNPLVLIPRPETELLVETAVQFVEKYGYRSIADIGTGSGCIVVSLAVHIPDITLYAVDISQPALDVARENSRTHKVDDRINFLHGDVVEPLPCRVDMIAANLPYIDKPGMELVNTRGYEPETALYGGIDGLKLITMLIRQSGEKLNPGGTILLEIGAGQSEAVKDCLRQFYPEEEPVVKKDLAGIERVVSMTISPNPRTFS